jgi:hypothetical protein
VERVGTAPGGLGATLAERRKSGRGEECCLRASAKEVSPIDVASDVLADGVEDRHVCPLQVCS